MHEHPFWSFFLGNIVVSWVGFVFCCFVVYWQYLRQGLSRPPKGERRKIEKIPFWKAFFWLLPKRIVKDWMERDPDAFTHQGCIIFTGRQGNGKTIAMAHQISQWHYEFPKSKVLTNFAYVGENDVMNHWRKLVDYTNGVYGVIAAIDETQNWFSSNQSKDFPPEMLQVVTQNRKNRRVILGTAQSFNRLSKPIREQATEVRKCKTFFGAVTFVLRQRPELDAEGNVTRWVTLGWYYFVHTDEIRNSYDTYRVIASLAESGFQSRPAPGSVQESKIPRPVPAPSRRRG